jgi:Nucleotidyl transferase AbiEii toxin, Type IV TA system
MPENYLTLSPEDRLEALGVAATESGRPDYLLEKDVWVVWVLDALFTSEFAQHLVFKGGTSLSKGYDVIERFSEDIDVTYDIRQLVPELAAEDPIPKTNAQADHWKRTIDDKLAAWVKEKALPVIEKYIEATSASVTAAVDGTKIVVEYERLTEGPAYVQPRVIIEFGARSTGEPAEKRAITCDAAAYLPNLQFPTATPNTMLPKRTFWEKATAAHVFCARGHHADRYSRHWHDLVRLDDAGYADEAFNDRALAQAVATFKGRFFRDKDKAGNPIDYAKAVSGELKLVPDAEELKALEADYQKMVDAGLLVGEAEAFDTLIERCAELERRANGK